MVLLVIGAVAVLVGGAASGRAFWARGDQNTDERWALRILEDRFASGEIDREEFERRRAILTRGESSSNRREEGVVMLRRLVGVAALAAALLVGTAAPGLAEDVTPGGGSSFGQHVAGMAPEHAIAHGADFGTCVSAMARGLTCPHTHP